MYLIIFTGRSRSAAACRSLWVEKFPLMLHRDPGLRNPRLKVKVHCKWTSELPRIPYRQQSTVNRQPSTSP
ncbi:hypothetical protein NWP21_16725 [Anabaenopsis sp. FSS-46]|uniref:hypothetical protein n=1 Tax=Anabaenopsis sp. FSS-46 TaxID=2971766 RepID=UPI002477202A|nr:hypothetical protein [Anabaenopsis sp. FSS-46]MDH6100453.1 hypothetical protein [Anabaenopsis sp. FSS-46]